MPAAEVRVRVSALAPAMCGSVVNSAFACKYEQLVSECGLPVSRQPPALPIGLDIDRVRSGARGTGAALGVSFIFNIHMSDGRGARGVCMFVGGRRPPEELGGYVCMSSPALPQSLHKLHLLRCSDWNENIFQVDA